MKNRRNYYRILHVQPDAPAAIIQSSYRTLMQKLKAHPDLGGDDWNAALINEAFAVVMDPARRAHYDRELQLYTRRRDAAPATVTETSGQAPPRASECATKSRDACLFCQAPQQALSPYQPEDVCPRCRSPLRPVRRFELEGSCKRAVSRVDREGTVRIYTHWSQPDPYPGLIVDLSPHGARVTSPRALPIGTLIKLEGSLFCALTRVVNCLETGSAPGFHLGTEFLTLAFAEMRGTFLSTRT